MGGSGVQGPLGGTAVEAGKDTLRGPRTFEAAGGLKETWCRWHTGTQNGQFEISKLLFRLSRGSSQAKWFGPEILERL